MATGSAAIESLVKRFPQLYVAPAEGAQEAHRKAAGRGIAPEGANLEHFVGSEEDELRLVSTPAGSVEVLFLKLREDFETFLRIVGNKAQPVEIPRTIGAITYQGLADWGKVAKAYTSYKESGGTDWHTEFARLAKEPRAFRTELVVISEGPYSNIDASRTPFDASTWLELSREIRLHHECAHVVCRRLMPTDILPVWDEVTADVTGLLCATKRYDAELAALFLGTSDEGYCGGRLYEYLDDDQRTRIDELAREVHASLLQVEELSRENSERDPFDFLLDLKKSPLLSF